MENWNIVKPSVKSFLRNRAYSFLSFLVSVGRSNKTSTHIILYSLNRVSMRMQRYKKYIELQKKWGIICIYAKNVVTLHQLFWMTYTIRIIPLCKHLGWGIASPSFLQNNVRKIISVHLKSHFICISQKKVVSLHPQRLFVTMMEMPTNTSDFV